MWKVHTQDPRGNTEGTRTLKRKVKVYSNLTTDQKVRGSNPFGRTFGRSPASIRMWEIFLCAGVVAGGRNGRQWVISYTLLHGWVACVAAKKRLVMVGFAVVA